MVNYNSFQAIIDAFKTEYVNARNLKKSANSKKRAARNAASFNTRKENESTVLETKLTSIESSLDSTLSTAFDSVDSVRFTDLSKKLAELKGKLSLFDAEIDRLNALVNIDSEKYDPWTSREQQAHQMVRNVLVDAISEAESVISDLYTGVDYSAVKAATIPNALTHPASEVVTYFASLKSNFDSVKYDLKTAVDEYTQDIFKVADDINEKSYRCIQDSKYLLVLKSELADLLDNGGSESDINAKETDIEGIKAETTSDVNELKAHWAKFDSFIGSGSGTVNRFTKIIKLSQSLEDIYYEAMQYRNLNEKVLSVTVNFVFDSYSGYEILGVFSELFEKITDNAESLLNIQDFNPGYGYRRQQIMGERSAIFKSEAEMNAIRANDIFTQNPSTGHYELKKDINPNLVSKYVTYQQHAGYITDLTVKHAERKSALERFDFYLGKVEGEGYDKVYSISNRYMKSRRTFKDLEDEYNQLSTGYWTGTVEQTNQRSTLWSSINGVNGLWDNKISTSAALKMAETRYSLHMQLFPDFYPTFETLNAAKATAVYNFSSLPAQLVTFQDSVTSTYNFLQTLTEVDEEYAAEYPSAFTAWNDANIALQPLLAAYNAITPQYNSLTSNLDEITALYILEEAASKDTSFVSSGLNGLVITTAIQSDGKKLLGGDFTDYNGTDAFKIIRLNADGSKDNSFVTGSGFNGRVRSIAIQSDGKILVGGYFYTYNGSNSNAKRIIRLNSDGSRDTSFDIGSGVDGGDVLSVVIQSDGKILVGGYFTSYNGTSANTIIRLNSNGSLDTSFVPCQGTNGLVYSVAIQSDGKILLGGDFTVYNGTPASKIIRLNSNGSVDTSFVSGSGFNVRVRSFAIQSDGKILVGGDFSDYKGTPASSIIRLNSDGSRDTSFDMGTGFNNSVFSIAIQSDGKILVGGYFTYYQGTPASYIIRLNSNGSRDTSFVTGTGFNNYVFSIDIQSDGKILVGGYFTSYNGTSANYIIRLYPISIYNVEFEDDFTEATDTLNTFLTDIYNPALEAKTAAEIVTNAAYNFLQTLTEVDEEYQAALAAWESAVSTLEGYNDTYLAAEVSMYDAIAAYEAYIQGTHDVVGLPVGTYTVQGTTLAGYYNDKQDTNLIRYNADAALNTAESELQTLEGQMTRSTPTENDKRDKAAMNRKFNQAYLLNMKFEEDYLAGIDTLMYIIKQKITQAKDRIIEIDNYLPALTAEAMAFITGTVGPNINPLFDSVAKHDFSYELKKYHSNMASMEKEGLANIMNSLGIICNTDETSLIDVSVFNNFVLDLSSYVTERYIRFNRNISTLVINEVENGGSSF
jgi:uncharacterized delta-60 repeat protein